MRRAWGLRQPGGGLVLLGAALAAALGCGGRDAGVGPAKLPAGVRAHAVEHERCDETGARVLLVDVNGDGKPDIRRVHDGAREVCRISDLDYDGKPDMFEYYDASGQLRRREADYGADGIVNAIEIYEGGRLVRAELDTTNDGTIDTWDTFDPVTGARLTRERASKGGGRVDQWWTYEGGRITVAMDRDGDGLPDPDAVVTLGEADQAAAPPPPADADAGAGAPTSPSQAEAAEPSP